MIPSLHFYTDLGLLVGFLGALGLLVNKRHLLLAILCIEIRFFGFNFLLVARSPSLDDILGALFGLFVLTLAAAESALALGLLRAYFKVHGNILLRED
jgi:NADH:ubiquinone oxidoreductase subunit K